MTTITIDDIRQALRYSESERAITLANALATDAEVAAQAIFLRGNAHRQLGHWREALNDYLAAAELDPDGPAADAYRHTQEILAFYHHDLYNP